MSQFQAEWFDPNPFDNTVNGSRATPLDDTYPQPGFDLAGQPQSLYENELSEEQLRELYDTEEIQRFLHLFSAVRPVLQPS